MTKESLEKLCWGITEPSQVPEADSVEWEFGAGAVAERKAAMSKAAEQRTSLNKDAGRDHWAPVNCALMAGGGMPTGQVLGGTDKIGAYATVRPIHYRDILATIYHNLGIDPHTQIRDQLDRPVYILPDDARPVRELCA
jgi:hypothetical protein